MELLLEKGADVNATSKVGTPLLWALGANAEACALLLLEHGADPQATDPSNITPVLLAVATGLYNALLCCKCMHGRLNGLRDVLPSTKPSGLMTMRVMHHRGHQIGQQVQGTATMYIKAIL